MTTPTIETMVARWTNPASRPLFKGSLIDDTGCCCAQGDVLRVAGWSDEQLRKLGQDKADSEVATLLNISRTHAVLLRIVNDREKGCPQDVFLAPEKVIGDNAQEVLRFWRHLDATTNKQWCAAEAAAEAAASDAAEAAASDDAWYAASDAASDAAKAAAGYDAWNAASDAAKAAAGFDAGYDAWNAAGATNEIQGLHVLRAQGREPYFLPMFGFVPAA